MINIWKKFTRRVPDEILRNGRGLYTILPRANPEDLLSLKVGISYPDFSAQPLFVLSRGNWHCQYQSASKANMFSWRNNDRSHQPNPVIITTGLSGILEPFQLRIFFMNNGFICDWSWKPTDASYVLFVDSIESGSDKHQSTINLSGSDKWYEADTYEKGLLLRGNGKFGPHETEENARRRFHGGD